MFLVEGGFLQFVRDGVVGRSDFPSTQRFSNLLYLLWQCFLPLPVMSFHLMGSWEECSLTLLTFTHLDQRIRKAGQ